MYKLFSGGNFGEVVERIQEEGYAVKNAEVSGGIMTALCEKTSKKEKLGLKQGYNHSDLIEKINENGEHIECSILAGPVKFFFVREKPAKSEKK